MKKYLKLLLAVLMVVTVSGCSGSGKKPSDYYDLLRENDCHLLVSFDYTHFYDEDLNCYDEEGKKIDDVRLVEKPGKNPLYLFYNDDTEQAITVYFDGKTKKPQSFYFLNNDGSYVVDFNKKTKSASLFKGDDDEKCEIYYEGESKSNGDKCSRRQTKIADGIKEQYEGLLRVADISEEDLEETFVWFSQEKVPTIKKELTSIYNKQEPLSNDEIIDAFKKNKFNFVKDSDGTLNFKYISSLIDSDNKTFTALVDENNKLIGVVYLYGLYYQPSEISVGMMCCYYVDMRSTVVLSNDGKYAYNVDLEQSLGAEECDEDFIKTAGTLKFTFEQTLEQTYITIDELVNFFKTYEG